MNRKIIVIFILCFLLVGCKSNKVLQCSYSDKNSNMIMISTQKYIFNKDGNKLQKINITIEYDLNEQYISYLTGNNIAIEEAIDTKAICSSYKSKGECVSKYKDNKLTIEINIKIDKDNKKLYNGDYNFYKNLFEEQKYECK